MLVCMSETPAIVSLRKSLDDAASSSSSSQDIMSPTALPHNNNNNHEESPGPQRFSLPHLYHQVMDHELSVLDFCHQINAEMDKASGKPLSFDRVWCSCSELSTTWTRSNWPSLDQTRLSSSSCHQRWHTQKVLTFELQILLRLYRRVVLARSSSERNTKSTKNLIRKTWKDLEFLLSRLSLDLDVVSVFQTTSDRVDRQASFRSFCSRHLFQNLTFQSKVGKTLDRLEKFLEFNHDLSSLLNVESEIGQRISARETTARRQRVEKTKQTPPAVLFSQLKTMSKSRSAHSISVRVYDFM